MREYLFVGIDDFSRELYAGIYPPINPDLAQHYLYKQCVNPMFLYH
jgi:phosphatidylethanolamine-binding protein (PEBP) family uncharacterized protein